MVFDPGAVRAPPGDLPAEFHTALAADNLIEAIKIYRKVKDVGLKQARDAVLAMKMK